VVNVNYGQTADHNQQGNRRVIRLEKNGQVTVLADLFDTKLLVLKFSPSTTGP
jgi:hypothetical protein